MCETDCKYFLAISYPVFYSVAILYDLDISIKQLHKRTKHKENCSHTNCRLTLFYMVNIKVDLILNDWIILIGIIFKFTLHLIRCPYKQCRPIVAQVLSHFQTLTMPSLEEVTIKPWVVWNVAISVMMSWWPTGRDSGPRRGVSSVDPLFCLLWISWWGEDQINISMQKPKIWWKWDLSYFFRPVLLLFLLWSCDCRTQKGSEESH